MEEKLFPFVCLTKPGIPWLDRRAPIKERLMDCAATKNGAVR
jgi:hypothetical protein